MRYWLQRCFIFLFVGFSSLGTAEDFKEGEDYRILATEIILPGFIQATEVSGKVQIQKYFSLACKPCFALDALLDAPRWKALRDKANVIHIHRLKHAESGNRYNNYDYPVINAYHLLEEWRESLQWSQTLWKALLLSVHEEMIKNNFALILQPWLMGSRVSECADSVVGSCFPIREFVNAWDGLDDESEQELKNVELVRLSETVGMTSIPALVIGGKYLVERSHVMQKYKGEPDLDRMLRIADYLTDKVINSGL